MTPVLKSMTKRNILTGIIDRNKSARNWEIVRDNKTNNNVGSNSKYKKKNNVLDWKWFVFRKKKWRRKWNFKIVPSLSLSSIRNNNNYTPNLIMKRVHNRSKKKIYLMRVMTTIKIILNQRSCKSTSSLRIFSYRKWW